MEITELQQQQMSHTKWDEEMKVVPKRPYTSIELFAGAGGLALGMEKAGFVHILLNDIDHNSCETLKVNRPQWNVVEQDMHTLSFKEYKGEIDFLSGGFPCQAFSSAGKRLGFNDTRGTLFFELARAIDEVQPKVFLCENVKGLVNHDKGRTLDTIKNVIKELGYTLVGERVLKAVLYKVPQKRERLFLIAIRNDIANNVTFKHPDPYHRIMTIRDAFFKGELFDCDVPPSNGSRYSKRKEEIMRLVPMGGCWRDLPIDLQKEYLNSLFGARKVPSGIAHRLSYDEPSTTLTCGPASKLMEKCHPTETRPLTIREYARIQTFPDDWLFQGGKGSQYKQIGNAVPVNLAYAIGRSLIRLFNDIESIFPKKNL